MITVTVYDDISLIPSFWFLGFQNLSRAGKIRLRFKRGRSAPVSHEERKWKSTLFEITSGGKTRVAVIDIFDRYDSLNPQVLETVDQYFKFNFNPDHIQEKASAYRDKIFPTGFYFPVRYGRGVFSHELIKRFLAGFHARERVGLKVRLDDAKYSLREYKVLVNKHSHLEYYTENLRGQKEDLHDLFWNVNYWSPKLDEGYGSIANCSQRVAIMQIIERLVAEHSAYKVSVGFFDNPDANRDYPQYVMRPTLPTREYLQVVARSKVSIVSRGLSDCFSWRMGEHMAMGKFALVERPLNATYVPLSEGKDVVYFENDLSDLEDKLSYYLRHDNERQAIANRSKQYFDQYCRPEVQLKYMINNLMPGVMQ